MANGVYGTNIPALIQDNNISKYVDIYYSYSKTKNSNDVNSTTFTKLDASNLKNVIGNFEDTTDTIVEGLYNLNLPLNLFGSKGFYTIYIKPKEIEATILDVSTLKDFPNVRGIVLDTKALSSDIQSEAQTNNGLVGYRVIYKESDGTRSNEIRIVTSNNRCEAVVGLSSANSSSYSYQYNENASLTFLTLSPSMPLSFKASSTPYIGTSTQNIYLVNTYFEPVCIELEMVGHDSDSIAELMTATQLRDLNNGIITSFDSDNNIISQHEMSTLKSSETGTPQYEVKEKRTNNIDYTQTITDKIS